jgi:tripartite-type tricarboxylate transporter receptor subunit TctC
MGIHRNMHSLVLRALRRAAAPLGKTFFVAGACIAATFAAGASAADFPDRPIQMVVPFAAGGGLDQNARGFSQALSEVLKAPVAVVNRDGAAGTIGLQSVAGARADGYTLAFTPAVPLTSEPHRLKTIRYGLESFTPVCQVFDNIFAVVVISSSPYKTLRDLIDDARARPGAVSYGTSGTGSVAHLGGADIEAATKIQMTHVPYKGDGPMLQDLIAGRLGFGAMLASSVSGQIQAGSMRLLAVYADRRHPSFPAVPTLAEAGVPVAQLSFGGVLMPANAPADVVQTLQAACERAVKATAYNEWAARAGQVVDYRSGADFSARIRQDSQAKAAVIKRLGL